MGPRPASKRQRVSGESAGSSSMPTSPVDTTQMLQNFKELSLDNKLETMFSCLLDVKATNDRLLNAERMVKHIKESTQVNCRRIDLLATLNRDNGATIYCFGESPKCVAMTVSQRCRAFLKIN